VRHIRAALHATAEPGSTGRLSHALLESTCSAAGIRLGAFDHRILAWLSSAEAGTVAVVAGLISRAHASGDEPALVLIPGGSRQTWKLWTPGKTAEPACEGTLDQVITASRLIPGPLILDDPLGSDWERPGSLPHPGFPPTARPRLSGPEAGPE